MTTRYAARSCEQLRLEAESEPVRVSMCHCLACTRRTGSAFGVQARFEEEQVRIEGRSKEYVRELGRGGRGSSRSAPSAARQGRGGASIRRRSDRFGRGGGGPYRPPTRSPGRGGPGSSTCPVS